MMALLIFALSSSVAWAQTNPHLLAKFEKLVKESEGLQIPPVTDANLSKLYFLDKKIRDICPKSDPKEPCVSYISQNSLRFSAGEVARVAVQTYLLTKQKVRDPVA